MKFRKKPVVIDAVLFTGRNPQEIRDFIEDPSLFFLDDYDRVVRIITLEGEMKAMPGDWIIKGVKGEFYPCKPDIFEATYEEAGV